MVMEMEMEMEIFFSLQNLVLLVPLFFYLYYLLLLHLKKTSSVGFQNYPILGTIPDFLLNRHRFLDWSTHTLSRSPTNTAVFRRPGKIHGIITANPANVQHMLKTNFQNYPKGTRFLSLLQDFLGAGIFNSDGEIWKTQRKTASYEFNTRSLRHFVMDTAAVQLQTRFIPVLEKAAETHRTLDLQDLLERFAFDNICKVAFNVDPGCLAGDGNAGNQFMKAFEEAATLSSGRFMYAFPVIYLIKKRFNLGSEKKLRRSIRTVHEFADKIIRSRMEEKAEKINDEEKDEEDLLSRFMGNSEHSPDFLRDIVISFILAGRDTTSSGLTWFFWVLSSHPQVEQNILIEIQRIRARFGKNTGEGFGFDELREMHYLHAAISEGLRLYPPVPVDTKACIKEDVMPDGTFVGEGWFATYHTYAMGRMESVWGKDCGEFRPERWLEEGVYKTENPFKYPVFHGGPRMCLGKDMAYIQMKSIAATVIEKFAVEVVARGKTPPEHVLSLTMRMKGGLMVKVRIR